MPRADELPSRLSKLMSFSSTDFAICACGDCALCGERSDPISGFYCETVHESGPDTTFIALITSTSGTVIGLKEHEE